MDLRHSGNISLSKGGRKFSSTFEEVKKKDIKSQSDNLLVKYVPVVNHEKSWSQIGEESSNAVVKILAQIIKYDWSSPWSSTRTGSGIGTGFVINAKEKLIVTNAHVVDGSRTLWITITGYGEERYSASIVGICFDLDLAVIKCTDDNAPIMSELKFGKSDKLLFGDSVIALGFPLGMNSLKYTVGIVSGRQDNLLQTDAPLNPGNSGGPLLNRNGEVVGINVSIIAKSNNVGFAIPSYQCQMILSDLITRPRDSLILHKPVLGATFIRTNKSLHRYFETDRSGIYISNVFEGFPFAEAGIKAGDILHSFNGFQLDNFGEANVKSSKFAKASVIDLLELCTHRTKPVVEYSRNGEIFNTTLNLADETDPSLPKLPVTRLYYPPFEKIDYEVFGGFAVSPLTLNHLKTLEPTSPELIERLLPISTSLFEQSKPRIIIFNVLISSEISKYSILEEGDLISEINNIKVSTLTEYREALKKPINKNGEYFITLKTDTNILTVLSLAQILEEEYQLSMFHQYPISPLVDYFIEKFPEFAHLKEPEIQSNDPVLTLDQLIQLGIIDESNEEDLIISAEEDDNNNNNENDVDNE
eukprot:TRINITY_DN197_c0_g1_i2.p1 TRINITY_DN197_c0_g1~~TRINITY_DN197_c0_g1_i2.p1  ORF type:complete len:587 (+),score=192.48 TRINITY_DN197_c0_g1_i2:64-1824(+)